MTNHPQNACHCSFENRLQTYHEDAYREVHLMISYDVQELSEYILDWSYEKYGALFPIVWKRWNVRSLWDWKLIVDDMLKNGSLIGTYNDHEKFMIVVPFEAHVRKRLDREFATGGKINRD